MTVQPKKSLGQHFLKDPNIARKIVSMIMGNPSTILEVGPGMGALTKYLIELFPHLMVMEIDKESVGFLRNTTWVNSEKIIEGDFLKAPLENFLNEGSCIVGNFPYNISNLIFFKILDYKHLITQVVGMVQYEVAERIASSPGTKNYGILSVLLQAYFKVEILFKVPPSVFYPVPKVNSAVIRLQRNEIKQLPCNEDFFKQIVKTSFGQRRKMLRNSLKNLFPNEILKKEIFMKRPETLSIEEFILLTQWYESHHV